MNQIAVVGIVFFNDKCLFLKRAYGKCNWCPPCGKVESNENLTTALKREVQEEAGLDIEIIMPINSWIGDNNGEEYYSISYACRAKSKNITLSSEHVEYKWIPFQDLNTVDTDFDTTKWQEWIQLAENYSKQLLDDK